MWLNDTVCSGGLAVEQGLRQGCVLAPSPVKHLLHGGYKRGLHAFQGGQRHHVRFGTLEEENGVGEAEGSKRRRASPGDVGLGHVLR